MVGQVTFAAVSAVTGVALLIPPAAEAPNSSLSALLSHTGGIVASAVPQISPDEHEIKFHTYIANYGDQSEVDACTGGLTYFVAVANHVGKPYFPIHNYCGGHPLMNLRIGDLVSIRQLGVFEIVSMRDVSLGDTASMIKGLPGEIYLQTCYDEGQPMRVLGLNLVPTTRKTSYLVR